MFGVCVCLFCVYVVRCLGCVLATGWYHSSRESYRLWKMIMELNKRPGPWMGWKSHWIKILWPAIPLHESIMNKQIILCTLPLLLGMTRIGSLLLIINCLLLIFWKTRKILVTWRISDSSAGISFPGVSWLFILGFFWGQRRYQPPRKDFGVRINALRWKHEVKLDVN
jgi:hypothetical protein